LQGRVAGCRCKGPFKLKTLRCPLSIKIRGNRLLPTITPRIGWRKWQTWRRFIQTLYVVDACIFWRYPIFLILADIETLMEYFKDAFRTANYMVHVAAKLVLYNYHQKVGVEGKNRILLLIYFCGNKRFFSPGGAKPFKNIPDMYACDWICKLL